MRLLRRVRSFLRSVFRRAAVDAAIEQEMRSYVEERAERSAESGVDPREARRQALAELGGLRSMTDRLRDDRRGAGLAQAIRAVAADARYALRLLRRSPSFTAIAVTTLAIGIGANTAIFGIVNSVLLRPLPYSDPGSLVLVEPSPLALSPDWLTTAWRARARSLRDFAGFNGPRSATLIDQGESSHVMSANVTWNLLSFLGVRPAAGRDLAEADSSPAATPVVVLSHDFWTRRFGGDPNVLGRSMRLGGGPVTVVGILAPDFKFPTGGTLPAAGIPAETQPDVMQAAKPDTSVNIIGRLRPGTAPAEAATELLAIFKQEAASIFRQGFIDRSTLNVTPLQQRLVGSVEGRLLLVMGAVGLLLLVACANVANLLLARASTRHRELAVRVALGARTSAIVRLLLVESLVLSFIGSIVGLFVAWWGSGIARAILADRIPFITEIAVDRWLLAFNVGVAVITGALCGLAALPRIRPVHVNTISSDGGARVVSGGTGVRRALLVVEVAVTFVLVVGAFLLAQTIWNLSHQTRGFDASRLLTVRVNVVPGDGQIDLRESSPRFFADVTARLGRLPGVVTAAATSTVPLAGGGFAGTGGLVIQGQPAIDREAFASVAVVSPRYFRTMGIAIEGRDFDERDRQGADRAVIVNRAFQRRFAPVGNVLGAQMSFGDQSVTIVGLVEDVPEQSFRSAAEPLVFTPLAQMREGRFGWGQLTFVLRSQTDEPAALAPAVRRAIWEVEPSVVIDELVTMDERVSASLRAERDSALIFGVFALTALVMAAVGVYGVAAFSVARRTKEIGIRVALGAARHDVVRLVIEQTLLPTVGGLLAGAGIAALATRFVAGMVFGVSPVDPVAFVGTALVLLTVAAAATYLPARRAMRLDPLVALRHE